MATAAVGLSSYHTLYITADLQSQNVGANTSVVSRYARIVESGNYGAWSSEGYPWNAYVDGQGVGGSAAYDFRGAPDTVVLCNDSVTVPHNADGTKSISFSAYYGDTAFPSGIGSGTASGSTSLPTIPRATTPVLSDSTPDTGQSVTITLTPASASFSHRLHWAFQPGTGGAAIDNKIVGLAGGGGSASGTVEGASADGTAGNYWGVPAGTTTPTLTVPHAVFEQSVDQATRTLTLTVDTYNGSTYIGTKTVAVQLSLAASQKPTIVGITHSEATTSPNVASLVGAYVQAVTKLTLALTSPAGIHGSTIVSRSITVAGQTLTANGTTPSPINASGSVAITATVTDSRGRVSDVATQYVTVLAWSPPSFAATPSVVRALSSGVTDEDDGTYLKVDPADFSASSLVVSTVEKNKIEFRLSYRLLGSSTWTVDGAGWINLPDTPSVIRFTGALLSTFGSAALGSAYEVLIEIRDVLATSAIQRTVPKAQVLLHLKGSLGISVGARHSGASNPLEVWGRGKQASDGVTLRNIIDQGDLDLASPTGNVSMTARSTAPSGWLLCDGAAVSRSTYAALFSAIGTTYGTGDGSTTFNLPNLKGRIPVGVDSAQTEFNTLGEVGGEKAHTLTIAEMPAHDHGLSQIYVVGSGGNGMLTHWNGAAAASTAPRGGGSAHNNLQPYIALNYIIKT